VPTGAHHAARRGQEGILARVGADANAPRPKVLLAQSGRLADDEVVACPCRRVRSLALKRS
ncbi:MAG TPA: hypothetical protein VF664_09495, partial [Cystobacter sp.]